MARWRHRWRRHATNDRRQRRIGSGRRERRWARKHRRDGRRCADDRRANQGQPRRRHRDDLGRDDDGSCKGTQPRHNRPRASVHERLDATAQPRTHRRHRHRRRNAGRVLPRCKALSTISPTARNSPLSKDRSSGLGAVGPLSRASRIDKYVRCRLRRKMSMFAPGLATSAHTPLRSSVRKSIGEYAAEPSSATCSAMRSRRDGTILVAPVGNV